MRANSSQARLGSWQDRGNRTRDFLGEQSYCSEAGNAAWLSAGTVLPFLRLEWPRPSRIFSVVNTTRFEPAPKEARLFTSKRVGSW